MSLPLVQLADDSAALYAGSVVYILVAIFFLFLAAAWLIFPFIVISKFNELLKVQRETLKILRNIDNNVIGNLKIANALHQETTKLREDSTKTLQWMVDNWPEQAVANKR